jgi:hypothetical protein
MSVSNSTSDRLKRISRQSFGVRNRSPGGRMISEAVHQFHETICLHLPPHELFRPHDAVPALLLLLVLSNRVAAGTHMISQIVQVYPGRASSSDTIRSLSGVGTG